MPAWKVVFIAVFGLLCMSAALGTLVVPLTDIENAWVWSGGLLAATVVLSTLFTMFLKSADRAMKM